MSTGQALGGVVGAAAGFIIGGPTGAMYGAQIGMMAGGYLDPPKGPTMEGPRLSDLAVQTSTYGAFIPRVYGTVALNGNVFWLENNKLKEVVKKQKSGGKGGGSATTTKTYTYYATFAVGICEGPIEGVRRIWAGNTLIYDAGSTSIQGVVASNRGGINFSIYKGDDTQLPDTRMQAEMGAANCPAYRGLAYIVFKDFALAKYGNSLQGCPIKVEVVKDATFTNITQVGPTISGPVAQGSRFANVPYADYNGAYLWSCTDEYNASNVTTITQSLISNDGTVVPLRSARITAYDSAYLERIPRGHGDINHFALSSRQYGPESEPTLTIYNEDFSSARYKTGNPLTTRCENYLIHEGNLYIAGTLFTPTTPQLYVQPLGSGLASLVQQISFPFNGSATGEKCFGVVGGVLLISAFNSDTSTEALHAFDLSSYAYLGTTPLVGALGTIDFFQGVMYYQSLSSPWYLYKRETWNGSDVTIGSLGSDLSVATANNNRRLFMRFGTVFRFISEGTISTQRSALYTVDVLTPNNIPLSHIMASECDLSGILKPADVDFSALTDTVAGMKVSNISAIRSVVEILRSVRPFDVIQDGYQVKGVKRGGSSVASIAIGDLGQDQQLKQVREMDSQLPVEIVASYLDASRDYDVNQQVWSRPSTGTVNSTKLDLPVVLTATQAAQIVEVLGSSYWNERVDFGPFTLPPTFSNLQPADVVTLDAGYAIYELRLTSINYKSDGSLECMAKANAAATYVSLAESEETPGDLEIPLSGLTVMTLMDIPVIDETLQNKPGFAVALTGASSGWHGASLFVSNDNAQTWGDVMASSAPSTIGVTSNALAVHACNLIDEGSTLSMNLISGELSGITEAQMLTGQNIAAYGANGRWEILRFKNATLNGDGSYTISGMMRGDKGTEWATGLHVVGDYFVLLDDPDGGFVTTDTAAIGAQRLYRGVTEGDSIDEATSAAFTYSGENLRPLSPVMPSAVRDGSANIIMRWLRRTRVGGAWRDYVDAELGETTEAYEIDVMNGATVVRTITAATQTATYTSAQQVADFGSNQASVTVRIYQLSSVVGRGRKLEVTL